MSVNTCTDFTVRDEGSIWLFTAETPEAEDWWAENCEEGITFAGAFAVDHRPAHSIHDGIVEAGFNVEYA